MKLGSEDALVEWLRQRSGRAGHTLLGDDGAVISAQGEWAVTLDHQIAGVHFPEGLDPALVARRLLAVNASDLAAMGAQPRFAFLALAVPPDFDARRLLASLSRECTRLGVELAGGDVAKSPTATTSLTLLGSKSPKGRWLSRSNGRAGDLLWVGGSLGESAAGRLLLARGARMSGRRVELPKRIGTDRGIAAAARRAVRRHLLPKPQLELGRWLAGRSRVAAIDLSDGLALDLHRLCRESGVGATLESDALPRPARFADLCRELDQDPLELTLTGGEDYVLLFTLSPSQKPPGDFGCTRVGRLTDGRKVQLTTADGTQALAAGGWDHFETDPWSPS
ncbi:MAG: thiamine-phosphate kinase [Acidobacteria bacterium]|nr:MAG: thiamine-phosphate kinase [Acidobacteriota bacterium]